MKLKSWEIRAIEELEENLSTNCDIDFLNYPNATCPMEDSARSILDLVDTLIGNIDDLEYEISSLESVNSDKEDMIIELNDQILALEDKIQHMDNDLNKYAAGAWN